MTSLVQEIMCRELRLRPNKDDMEDGIHLLQRRFTEQMESLTCHLLQQTLVKEVKCQKLE
jgi:hypothetical protein